jgi:hypothetical protein
MSTEENQNEIELKAFEAALASLAPRADRLDRNRLMFLAGQQSRVGPAKCSPTKHSEKPLRKLTWPTAFSAMTCVSIVLAVLLAIRPSIPLTEPEQTSIAANKDKKHPATTAISECQKIPTNSVIFGNDANHLSKLSSPWAAFLQTMWNITNTENATIANQILPDSTPQYYSQLRNRILRNGLDSVQVAQYSGNISNNRNTEPSTYRELLREYLPELK